MRLHRWQALVLGAQLLLIGLLTTAVLLLPSEAIASKPLLEAVLVCVIAPCAVASPIVTAKLGGDLTQMTTFVLASSLLTSLLIPIVFPMLEPGQDASFLSTFLTILRKLGMVLLLPLVLGFIIRHREGKLYRWFVSVPDLSFYCWAVSLAITSGITIKNILGSQSGVYILLAIALLSLLTALGQFRLGRLIGRLCGTGAFVECICPGQGMFQKNTGLAIWIAYTYLSPTSSIGAGCYVLWQNLINSYELWRHRTREEI